MKGLGRKGQFYLIGASMILVIIAGVFILPSRYSHGADFSEVEILVAELDFESGRVMDFLTYNDAVDGEGTIRSFTGHYENYSGDFYFVYGNESRVNFFAHADSAPDVKVTERDGRVYPLQVTNGEGRHSATAAGGIDGVSIGIGGDVHRLTMAEGENFRFIVSQKVGRERFVSVN